MSRNDYSEINLHSRAHCDTRSISSECRVTVEMSDASLPFVVRPVRASSVCLRRPGRGDPYPPYGGHYERDGAREWRDITGVTPH